MTGDTTIRDYYGFEVKAFYRLGEIRGKLKAMQYIDSLAH